MTAASTDEFSILELERVVLKHIRVLIVVPLLLVIGSVGIWMLKGGTDYTAHSSFLPQGSESSALSQYAGIAAQFGVGLPSSGGQSVQFYSNLLETDVLLRALADSAFRVAIDDRDEPRVARLFTLYEIEGETEAERVRILVDRLREGIETEANVEAGIVTMRLTAPWPDLAEQLSASLLDLVNEFDLERRQLRATAERAFIEDRKEQAYEELVQAEEALRRFLEDNRSYQNSPQLTFEFSRLQRIVDLRQQVYSSLTQAYEEARLAEVRNTPVITIIDRPEGTAEPTSSPIVIAVAAGIVGIGLAIGLAFLRELSSRFRNENPAEYLRTKELRDEAWRRLLFRSPGD